MKNYDALINELNVMVQSAKPLPMTGGKIVVDGEKILRIIDDMSTNVPAEIKKAKGIVADSKKIINDAKNEAEDIVRQAQERRSRLVEESEITKQAKMRAEDIINDATLKSKEIRKALNDYVDGIMKRADDILASNLNEFRKTAESLKTVQKHGESNNGN